MENKNKTDIDFAIKNNIPYYLMDGEPIVFLINNYECIAIPLYDFIKVNSIESIYEQLTNGTLLKFSTKHFCIGHNFCFDTIFLILDLQKIHLKFKEKVIKNNSKYEKEVKK